MPKKSRYLGVSGPVGNPTFAYAHPEGYGYSFGARPDDRSRGWDQGRRSLKPRNTFGTKHVVGAAILALGTIGLAKFFGARGHAPIPTGASTVPAGHPGDHLPKKKL